MVGTDMSTWLHDEEGRRRLAMVSLPSTRVKGQRKILKGLSVPLSYCQALSTLKQHEAGFGKLRSHPSVRFQVLRVTVREKRTTDLTSLRLLSVSQAYVRCRRAVTPAAALRGPAPRLCTLTATLRAAPSTSQVSGTLRWWSRTKVKACSLNGASRETGPLMTCMAPQVSESSGEDGSMVVHLCWVDQSHMVSQHEALFTRGPSVPYLDPHNHSPLLRTQTTADCPAL